MKNIYFLSDAHLGSLAIEHGRTQERRIVRFLDSIKHKAQAIYLLGDIFDFWNSRLKHMAGQEPRYMGEDKEHLVLFTKDYLKTHSDVDYFIYGHRHIELDLVLSRKARMIILGDWITQFTYAVFDGEHLFLEQYIEGESIP